MSDFLELARDFIERMTNPAYGAETNEDYAIRLGRLLRSESFRGRLTEEVATVRDRDALTSHGWMWLLEWAKANGVTLPEDLLLELFDEWSSVFAKAEVIDVATARAPDRRVEDYGDATLEEFPHSFLRRLLLAVTGPRESEPRPFDKRALDEGREGGRDEVREVGRAGPALVALMQVGRPIALDAAAVLLRHRWPGRAPLLEYFWALAAATDDETREIWIARLQPPERPRDTLRVR